MPMTPSLFSRFQGCLLMTFLAPGNDPAIDEAAITSQLQSWGRMFHAHPYQEFLPEQSWDANNVLWPTPAAFCQWLVVLALWHHENPRGFSRDLGRGAEQFPRHFPHHPLSPLDQVDQTWLHRWQRLLTLILSERFTLAQWPALWRSPFWGDFPTLTESMKKKDQQNLMAIATALDPHQTPHFAQVSPDQTPLADQIPRAIYHWVVSSAQPRFTLLQCRADSVSPLTLPFTAALSGAYNGETIVRQALGGNLVPHAALIGLINQFTQQHFLQWSGSLSAVSTVSSLTNAAPLVMQRRSSLKLVSQRDYGPFA